MVVPLYVLELARVSMPPPSLVSEPLPLRMPLYVVVALLFPTVRARAAGEALFKVKVPAVPCNPPKVALVSVPKLSVPVPLASKVLMERAAELARLSVPALTSVVPLKLLLAERVSAPGPFSVKEPVPLMTPEKVCAATEPYRSAPLLAMPCP